MNTEERASDRLKPCPFCGSPARLSFSDETVNVRCIRWGSGCLGAGANQYDEAEARTSWNSRARDGSPKDGGEDATPQAQQPGREAARPAYLSDGKQAFPVAIIEKWPEHNRRDFTIPLYEASSAGPLEPINTSAGGVEAVAVAWVSPEQLAELGRPDVASMLLAAASERGGYLQQPLYAAPPLQAEVPAVPAAELLRERTQPHEPT